jgi:hypothetical protein
MCPAAKLSLSQNDAKAQNYFFFFAFFFFFTFFATV